MNRKIGRVVLAVVALLSIGMLIVHVLVRRQVDETVFTVSPAVRQPDSVKYRQLTIGDHRIHAWITMPNTLIKNNTAIVIFHGIGESLSDWINVQKMLAGRGIVSAVFDYGSPADTISGQSGTSLRPLTDDVQDIIDSVRRLCGNDLHLFLLGHSVGNAVLLEMYPRLTAPFVKGVILCNAFSSLKKWLLYHHQISPAAALLFPDYLDNTDNVRNVAQPMLIVHSKADSVNYFEDALEIIRSAEYRHRSIRFVPTEEKDHNYIYNGRDHAGYWAPILHFIDSI